MPTRADSFTALKRNQEFFSDFLNNFDKTPIGNQLGRVTNIQAVTQSLKNLIKTNLGERLFDPVVGGNVYASLFELNTPLIKSNLEFYIENTIRLNEPRVNLISVEVLTSLDLTQGIYVEENTLLIKITFNLINNSEVQTVNFVLKRIR